MKKLVTILCLLALSLTSYAQGLGLPDNSASKPGRRFGIPNDYAKSGSKDMGKMVSDMKKAQDSDDPAAAMQEMIKNIQQYRTK